ncbi:MAG: hypothetical protein ATN35_09615 [Epulopiscium sp. Nele67-Bin004]|nr:MAG: hypothetical protein ATN35_09615 [Epulopiscium sp. Nele67-Bin004]
MPWEFDNNKPIYLQIMAILKNKIISGEIAPSEKLSSVRDLAQTAGVNPNTMQRALAELERENLVCSNRTSGRYVTDDEELIMNLKNEYAQSYISELVNHLLQFGYTHEQLIHLIKLELEKGETDYVNKIS